MFKKKEKKHFFNVTPDMSEYGTIVNLFQNDYQLLLKGKKNITFLMKYQVKHFNSQFII